MNDRGRMMARAVLGLDEANAHKPEERIGKYKSGGWWVREFGQETHFPETFKTKREAVEMAKRNEQMVKERGITDADETRVKAKLSPKKREPVRQKLSKIIKSVNVSNAPPGGWGAADKVESVLDEGAAAAVRMLKKGMKVAEDDIWSSASPLRANMIAQAKRVRALMKTAKTRALTPPLVQSMAQALMSLIGSMKKAGIDAKRLSMAGMELIGQSESVNEERLDPRGWYVWRSILGEPMVLRGPYRSEDKAWREADRLEREKGYDVSVTLGSDLAALTET